MSRTAARVTLVALALLVVALLVVFVPQVLLVIVYIYGSAAVLMGLCWGIFWLARRAGWL